MLRQTLRALRAARTGTCEPPLPASRGGVHQTAVRHAGSRGRSSRQGATRQRLRWSPAAPRSCSGSHRGTQARDAQAPDYRDRRSNKPEPPISRHSVTHQRYASAPPPCARPTSTLPRSPRATFPEQAAGRFAT